MLFPKPNFLNTGKSAFVADQELEKLKPLMDMVYTRRGGGTIPNRRAPLSLEIDLQK